MNIRYCLQANMELLEAAHKREASSASDCNSYKVIVSRRLDRPRPWQNYLLCGPLTHVDASFLEPVRASWISFVPCSESNSKSLRVPRPRPFLLATFSRSSFKDAPLHALFGLTVRLAVTASRCADCPSMTSLDQVLDPSPR